MPTVMLIGASGLQRGGLRHLLDEEGFCVIGEAASAPQALAAAPADAIVYDATRYQTVRDDIAALRSVFPDTRILLLASRIDAPLLREALAAGADGCLTADTSSNALGQWIHYTLAGGKAFPRDMAQLLAQSSEASGATNLGGRALSPREIGILHRLVGGCSNKQIANDFGITEATVKVHLKSLSRKINAANRTQAAIWAMNNGLTAGPEPVTEVG